MYSYLNGTISEVNLNTITLDVNGIGFLLNATSECLSKYSAQIGKTAKIYVYLNIKEDEHSLFGFISNAEKQLFLKLTTVNGVGAKTAIGILSGINSTELSIAIATKDSTRISQIKGIGKKTAERIILELGDKFSADISTDSSVISIPAFTSANTEALTALLSLGFTRAECENMLKSIDTNNKTTEQIVMLALRGNR